MNRAATTTSGVALVLRFALASLCLVAAALGTIDARAQSTRATHTVVIDGTQYLPATLTVHPGDTVVWVNKDPFPHTVTAKGRFDSGSIDADASWQYTAGDVGEYPYLCTFHPNMKGVLKVQ